MKKCWGHIYFFLPCSQNFNSSPRHYVSCQISNFGTRHMFLIGTFHVGNKLILLKKLGSLISGCFTSSTFKPFFLAPVFFLCSPFLCSLFPFNTFNPSKIKNIFWCDICWRVVKRRQDISTIKKNYICCKIYHCVYCANKSSCQNKTKLVELDFLSLG